MHCLSDARAYIGKDSENSRVFRTYIIAPFLHYEYILKV